MAENMRDLKRRMKSIESTEHITNAMRLVSAAKYKKAKNIFDKTNEQLAEVTLTIEEMLAQGNGLPSRYVLQTTQEKTTGEGVRRLIILITGSKGLCGGFNSNLMKESLNYLGISEDALQKGKYGPQHAQNARKETTFYAIGSKGKDYFRHHGFQIIGEFMGAPEKVTFADAKKIAKTAFEKFQNNEVDEVVLVSTKYLNSIKQVPIAKCLLPLDPSDIKVQVANTKPAHNVELELEPSLEAVVGYMLPKYFELTLFKSIIESAACEHIARRTAMENATDNANEILGKLSLTYNRVRQQAITNELIEIVSGSEAQ